MNYVKAISDALELAGYAASGIKYLVDHSGDITKKLTELAKMLNSAKKLMDTAADVVPIDNLLDKAEEEGVGTWGGVDTANTTEPAARPEVAVHVPKPKTPAFLKAAADRVAEFADEQKAGFERRKLEAEMLKAVHDSKQKVLEGATMRLPMTKLVEQLASDDEAIRIANLGVLDASGCFAIARYGKLDFGKDLTDYTGIYVGKDACVGEGIARTILPTGNSDVYADLKYKQNVWVYVFSCVPDKLDEKYEALVQLLEARESYNRTEADAAKTVA